MPVIGATQLEPVNILGSYVQGAELASANQLRLRQQAAEERALLQAQQVQNALAAGDRNALMRLGEPGLAAVKTLNDIQKQDREMQLQGLKTAAQFVTSAIEDPTTYPSAYQQALQFMPAEKLAAMGITEQYDPKALKRISRSLLSEAERLDAQLRGRIADVQERQVGVAEREVGIREQEAMAGPKPEKAPPGYRWTQSGDLEAIKGGPADVKGQQKESEKESGRGEVNTQVATMRDLYNQLDEMGAITSPARGVVENIKAAASSSEGGQMVGRALGTEAQSIRNTIKQQRPLLLQAIKRATGMTAKQMDSNVELQLYLSAATDPTLDIEANLRALDNLDRLYGLGEVAPARGGPTTRGRGKPSAAPSVEDLLNKYEK